MNTETTIETSTELEADAVIATDDVLIEDEESAAQQPIQARAEERPGARLQSARLAAKLSIDDVAEKLYLTKTIIQAIEKDDYQKTPALTFVRGYLRSYARLVKLSSDEIVASFDRLGLMDRAPKMPTDQIHRKQSSFFSRALPWFIAIAVVIVVGLVFIFWQSQDSNKPVSNFPTLSTSPMPQVSINGLSPSQVKFTVPKEESPVQSTETHNTETQTTAFQNKGNSFSNNIEKAVTPSTPISSKKPIKRTNSTNSTKPAKPSPTKIVQKRQSFWF